jgi:hypothetical protein
VQIFIVIGSTGCGSDRTSWNAKAFLDQIQAAAHIVEIEQELLRLRDLLHADVEDWIVVKEGQAFRWNFAGFSVPTKLATLDPNFVEDYTGVSYRVEELELVNGNI